MRRRDLLKKEYSSSKKKCAQSALENSQKRSGAHAGGAQQHGKCESLWRCVQMQRQSSLTGCHKLYSLLPFSASFCRLRAYIPGPQVQKGGGGGGGEREREDGGVVRGRFSSVCVWLSTGETHVKTLYMKSFNKIMTIPNTYDIDA